MKKRKLPLILQSEMAECGLACLVMMMVYFGFNIDLPHIRRKFKINLKGMTLLHLINIAEKVNLMTKVLRVNINQFSTLTLPCIIHWNMNHFMVLKKIDKDTIQVHDPSRGIRTIPIDIVHKNFSGIVLELKPKSNFPIYEERYTRNKFIYEFLKKYKNFIAKLFFLSCLIQLSYIISIRLIQYSVDQLFSGVNSYLLIVIGFSLFSLKLIENSALAIRSCLISYGGTLINCDYGLNIMKHLLSLPIPFFEMRHIGDIMSRFGAIEKIRTTVTEGMIEGLVDGLVSILTIISMAYFNFYLSIVTFVFAFLYFLSRIYFNKKSKGFHEEILHARAIELSHFMETLRAILSIRIFSKENERLLGWSNYFKSSLNATTRLSWHKIIYESLKHGIISVDLVVSLMLCLFFIANKTLTLGGFYAFMALRTQFFISIGGLMEKWQDYKLLQLHVTRLEDITLEQPETRIQKLNCNHQDKSIHLQVEEVSLIYPGDEKAIFQNLNFTVKAHECVVITGPSGCGKTTLLKMMMGVLPPTMGKIKFNQLNFYAHLPCYRKNIASVLQDDVLLSGTIADNISFFDPKPDRKRIYESARLASIIDEIHAFPMGFETLIGDMGSLLSGGQKQRILLARAFYAKPLILFLDEATSHLDAKRELEVNSAIRSLNITTVMVAHRKETIAMADRILKLEQN